MENFNVLAGLPRSGSTLLANILAQHPGVHVSGTSTLGSVVGSVSAILSNNPEVLSELAANPGMYGRYASALRGLVEGWYSEQEVKTIVDKGRAWPPNWALLKDIYPSSKMICSVRDPRDVIASIERQHRATGLFQSPVAPALKDSAESLMTQDGMVGGSIKFVEDMIYRKAEGVLFVRYESFVLDPQSNMKRISDFLELDDFKYDFENVESRGGDTDTVWRGKYPHEGSGPVKPSSSSWVDVMNQDLADLIASVYPLYMKTFTYGDV